MYVRVKRFRNKDGSVREYLYIVKGVRVDGRPRQKVVAYLGRLDELQREGAIDSLVEGLARYARRAQVMDVARDLFVHAAREYGPVLVFKRLWEELGLGELLSGYVAERGFEFDVVAAIFAMVLNRLLSPCSKLGVSRWVQEVEEPSFASLSLHHFYRALDVLWEYKEPLEEGLFWRRRDLFSQEVDLVFFDTTTVSFQGEGPEGLAEYGYSRDRRPDLKQIVVAVAMTRGGMPIAHEVFPGATSDVKSFAQVISSLKARFPIGRVIVVSDRGTVSGENLRLLSSLGLSYIVGVRMRRVREVEREILSRPGRYRKVTEDLKVKEVCYQGKRYIVCLNEEEAERDRKAREEMVERMREKLSRGGLKALVGNRGLRKYLRISGEKVEIDEGVLKREARYDGKYVLLTDSDLPAEEVALAYRGLWRVEAAFRELKDQLEMGPIYHWTEPRVRAHVAVCFLALLLEVELERRIKELGVGASFREVLRDLKRVKAVHLEVKGKQYLARTELVGQAYQGFRAAGVAVPPQVVEL